jgi:hypothetical protein
MSGFLNVGLAVMVVAVLGLFGRARWAHIASRRAAWLILAAGLGIGMAGCAQVGGGTSETSAPVSSAVPSDTATVTSPAAPAPAQTSSTPTPATSPTGTLRWQAGAALPDSKLTPGAVFPGVTAAQACTPGWAEAHRDVPENVSYQVFAEYGLPYRVHGSYEVDHLIPLELGGSNSIRNLWPQPQGGSNPGYPAKDRLENRLHELVCSGSLTLAAAQHAIATNWWAAYQTYIGAPAPSRPTSPAPVTSQTPRPSNGGLPVVHPGAFCSVAGARGVTSKGTPMICKTTATDSRLRWRAA